MSSSKRPTRPTCEHMNYSGPTEVPYVYIYIYTYCLVVSTPSKNISQLGLLFPIYGKTCSKPPTSIYIYIYLEIIPSTAAHHGLLSVKFPCVTCILHPSFHLHIFLQFSYPLPSDTNFAPHFVYQ